jgi:hypothetical protein
MGPSIFALLLSNFAFFSSLPMDKPSLWLKASLWKGGTYFFKIIIIILKTKQRQNPMEGWRQKHSSSP